MWWMEEKEEGQKKAQVLSRDTFVGNQTVTPPGAMLQKVGDGSDKSGWADMWIWEMIELHNKEKDFYVCVKIMFKLGEHPLPEDIL